uniref:Uncharacterized protein n=1 Tax=Anguilla anguilla TaxID=7936 RepID=A0A0E9SSL2_ANGAN
MIYNVQAERCYALISN